MRFPLWINPLVTASSMEDLPQLVEFLWSGMWAMLTITMGIFFQNMLALWVILQQLI